MGSCRCEITKKAMWLYPKVLGHNPPERWGHSACFSHGLVYVFGGCCGGLHFSDVLTLNLETMSWTTLATTGHGPGPRDSHSAVLVRDKMIIFGGTNGSKKVNDLHVLDLKSKEWKQPNCSGNPPSPRESHTATLVGEDKLVIFGGSGEGEGNYLNDLHVLDLGTMRWSSSAVKGDLPVPRDSHSAVAVDNKLVVYGGDRGDRYHGDVDVFDMDMFTWSRLAVQGRSPGGRAGHTAVNIGTKVYVIGGVGDRHYYNDVWTLDLITCCWMRLDVCGQQPQGRFSHAAVVTASDIVIYGGCGEDEFPLNEVLVLQLGTTHPNGLCSVSICKMFGSCWNQENRRCIHGSEENLESQSLRFTSDTLGPKRRRTPGSKKWEVDLEQEEHSLSMSQHSSPSQSDQEQPSVVKHLESSTGLHGFHLFKKQLNHSTPSNFPESINNATMNHQTQEQYQMADGQNIQHRAMLGQKPLDSGLIHSMIGADVRGKVDGVFDSGFLMTANVNGKIYRGVLFAPGPGIVPRGVAAAPSPPPTSHIAIAQPFPRSNHSEYIMPLGQSHGDAQRRRHLPVFKAAAAAAADKEPKQRSDLKGVVLTLAGPGDSRI